MAPPIRSTSRTDNPINAIRRSDSAQTPQLSTVEFSGKNPINPASFGVSSSELHRIKMIGKSRKPSNFRVFAVALATAAYILTVQANTRKQGKRRHDQAWNQHARTPDRNRSGCVPGVPAGRRGSRLSLRHHRRPYSGRRHHDPAGLEAL